MAVRLFFFVSFFILKTGLAESERPRFFLQARPMPYAIGLGLAMGHHSAGVWGFYDPDPQWYSSWGLEYSYHLNSAFDDGWYTKIYYEYRMFNQGLTVRDPVVPRTTVTVDGHRARHIALLGGYRWFFWHPNLFFQLGLGWQHNNNPLSLTDDKFGGKQSLRSSQEVAAELWFGYIF